MAVNKWQMPLAALLATMATHGAGASEIRDMAPTTPWGMHYAVDSCQLSRAFGEGTDRLTLLMTRFEPGPELDVIVAGKPVSGSGAFVSTQLLFGGSGLPAKLPSLVANTGTLDGMPMLSLGTRRLDNAPLHQGADPVSHVLPDLAAEQEAAVDHLTVKLPNGRLVRMQLGSMRAPMAAMRRCIDNYVRAWGFDPAEQASLGRRPWPESYPAMIRLVQADYLQAMLAQRAMANVHVRLDIDELGKVSACHIQATTASREAPGASCRQLMAYGKFVPAINADGKPVRSWFATGIHYRVH